MKKRLFTTLLILAVCLAGVSAQRTFKHPGSILGAADFERIRTHINNGDEPWASCWKALQNDAAAKSTYTASPSAEIGGSNGNRQRAASDAYAAMLNAIEWHVTGEERYAQCAARIFTAWGNKLETANDELFQYPCRAMIVAAELLRHSDGTFYEGWKEADRTVFLDKVRTVMVPSCRRFCTYQGTHPSWYTPCALAVLAAGVLLDDEELYREGYELNLATDHWNTMYGGSIEPDGQMREMGRDNVHGGLTLGDITQSCLVAWNQGDDLFAAGDNRLLRGMEYWCRYNTGHTDTPFTPLDCSGLDGAQGYSFYYISTHNNGFRLRPDACAFEAVYHHYREVKGMDAEKEFPYLTIAARLARPDNRADQMLGYGTLLFTIDAGASPMMTEVPQKPAGVRAEDGYKCVYLSWRHPEMEDVRGFRIYRSADGNNFTLLKTWDYYTNNEYRDEAVEAGKTYRYQVQFINHAGNSERSDIVTATAREDDGELPADWAYAAVNNSSGGGGFTPAQDSTFFVSGLGRDIGGTTDTHGFVYKKIDGDATLTVRLTSTDESFYKVGIMMRSSLNGNSQRVGLTLGETGCRMLRMCTRSSAGGNTAWVNGTNYGRAPLWLRIRREGNVFATFVSRDNVTWFEIGHTTVAMPATCYVGMAACTGSASGATYQAVFDHVSLEGTVAQPTAKPGVPTGFTAAWTDANTATMTWSPVADAASYTIYRYRVIGTVTDDELKDAAFTPIATVRRTSYTDTDATNGTWAYRVSALNAVGEGGASVVRQVTTDNVVRITGTVIGTSGSYGNNPSTTCKAALDDNISTFFDAPTASGAWVGYDLGENCAAQVVYVMYAPRNNYAGRMNGGRFQVAGKADFSDAVTIATIGETPAEGRLTKLAAPSAAGHFYRYLRYIGPDKGNCNVAEVQFYGRTVDGATLGIGNVDDSQCAIGCQQSAGAVYDLGGRRIADSVSGVSHTNRRGVYIVNGKKTIIE